MSGGIDLGTAWLNVVPSFKGVGKEVGKSLEGISKEVESSASGWGDSVKTSLSGAFSSTTVLAAAGTAVAAGVGGALYEIGQTFDSMTDTIRVGTGASGEALDGLVGVAQQVGSKVPASFDQVGTTVADLNTRLGLSGQTLETVASQYLEASRILGQDVDIQATTAAFSAFRIEGAQVEAAMDSLFQVSQATGVGMNELASAAATSAPAMQILGFGFEETTALIGSLDKAGIDSTQTMAAMTKGLVSLAKKGEEPQAAFKRVTSEIKDFIDAGDTARAIDLASGIFGTRAASQFVGAVQSGTLALDDLVGATGATQDTILGVGEETKDFAEQWQIVKNNAALALEPLASTVFQTLGDTLSDLVAPMQQASQWMQDNPALTKALVTAVGALSVALGIAAAAQWAVNIAMAANPIGIIVAALAALVAGMVYAYQNSETFRTVVQAAWEGIKAAASAVVNWFTTNVLPVLEVVWEGIKTGFATVSEWFTTTFLPAVQEVGAALSEFVSAAWDKIQPAWEAVGRPALDLIISVLQGVAANWGQIWDGIQGVVSGVWQVISTVVMTAVDVIKGIINLGTALITGDWQGAWDAVKGIASTVWDGIQGVVSGALDIIKGVLTTALAVVQGAWSGAWDTVKGVVSGAWSSVTSTVSGGVTKMIGFITSIPSKIKGAFASAGTWLLDAGRRVISGFVQGLKNSFSSVQSTLSGLTGMLPDWKGPAPRDEVLLRPAGELVIGGFREGLEAEYSSVRQSLTGFTKSLAADVRVNRDSSPVVAPAAARPSLDGASLVLRVEDKEFAAWVEEKADGRIITADALRR